MCFIGPFLGTNIFLVPYSIWNSRSVVGSVSIFWDVSLRKLLGQKIFQCLQPPATTTLSFLPPSLNLSPNKEVLPFLPAPSSHPLSLHHPFLSHQLSLEALECSFIMFHFPRRNLSALRECNFNGCQSSSTPSFPETLM